MGGQVFKGGTLSIRKERIYFTLEHFRTKLKKLFPDCTDCIGDAVLLGSAGKKDVSGDIDLAISDEFLERCENLIDNARKEELITLYTKRARTSTLTQITKRAAIELISEYINSNSDMIETCSKSALNGTLFCRFPQFDIGGITEGDSVQIDINFGDVDWLKFAYYSDVYEGNVKGLHRTQLMLSLFTNKGYVFSHNYGVKNKETNEIVATSPNQAIDLLNKEYNFKINQNILSNYFDLDSFLRINLSQEDFHKVYNIYLKILDSTRCDIPENLQDYWIKYQDTLGLEGKFLPFDSKLIRYKKYKF